MSKNLFSHFKAVERDKGKKGKISKKRKKSKKKQSKKGKKKKDKDLTPDRTTEVLLNSFVKLKTTFIATNLLHFVIEVC